MKQGFLLLVLTLPHVRKVVILSVVLLVVATAGGTGVLLGDDDLSFRAGVTVASSSAVAEAGYEVGQNGRQEFNATIPLADDDRQVVISQHQVIYQRADSEGPDVSETFVVVITTPKAQVAEQELNPFLRMDETDRIETLINDDTVSLRETDTYSIDPVGTSSTVTIYQMADGNSGEKQAYVHELEVEPANSDDVILAYALSPNEVHTDEQDTIRQLLDDLEYTPPDNAS